MFKTILFTWLVLMGVGAAFADVVYSNPNDPGAQWRNSQWQLQELERRQAQALEQIQRNQQSEQLNQRSYNVNSGYVPQIIENKDDGYYAAYVAAAMANKRLEPVAIYNHDGIGISKTYLRGETVNLPLGTLSLYVVGESKHGSVKPIIATYNCETHESTIDGKTTVLNDINSPYAVMFGQACRKSYEAYVKAQASK